MIPSLSTVGHLTGNYQSPYRSTAGWKDQISVDTQEFMRVGVLWLFYCWRLPLVDYSFKFPWNWSWCSWGSPLPSWPSNPNYCTFSIQLYSKHLSLTPPVIGPWTTLGRGSLADLSSVISLLVAKSNNTNIYLSETNVIHLYPIASYV